MWYSPLIPELRCRGKQISDLEASLIYRVSSRISLAARRNPVTENRKKKRERKKKGMRYAK